VSNSGNPARPATPRAWASYFGVHVCESNAEVLRRCDVVILAVKPHILPGVLAEVAGEARADHVFVSVAAGVSTAGRFQRGAIGVSQGWRRGGTGVSHGCHRGGIGVS